ncbi:hypothetical protein VL16_15820 [Chromobacterium violaceum]|nr:hypothetical protein VK93_12010 [Chromobacterium violaceum]KMO02888.1 hypothetical protein VL16_15820 [Chromobacterium violaceum]
MPSPAFRLTMELEPVPDGTQVIWSQRFEDAGLDERMAPIVIPANEQNLDRLTAEVLRGQRTGCSADDAPA